jgi:hypothetical protein
MSNTIIFHCGHLFHIESSTDYNYLNALKQDHNNKQAYIVCSDIGIILERFGGDHYINHCIEMIPVLQQKYGSCTVYKTHSALYDHNGDRR